jgi:hypothetical protein
MSAESSSRNRLARVFFGAVWDHRKATYNCGPAGTNNRFNISMFCNF